MGDKIASLFAEIGGDTSPLERALNVAKAKLDELGRASDQVGRGMADDFTRAGADFRKVGGDVDDYIGRLKASTPEMANFGLRYAKIRGEFETGAISSQEATAQLTALKNEMGATVPKTEALVSGFKSFISKAGLVAAGAVAIYTSLKKVYDLGKEGAALEYAAQKFDRLSVAVGTTSDKLMRQLREATKGTRSDMELMAGAGDLMALGLAKTDDQVVRLSKVVGGLGMDMNQLVLTLANQTTMRFDQLGVSVDGFDAKVEKLKKTGMSANDAFKEAFLQQAEEQLAKVGDVAETDAGKIARMEAATKNLGDAFKVWLAPGVAAAAEGIANAMTESQRLEDSIANLNDAYLSGAISIEEYNRKSAEIAKNNGLNIQSTGDLTKTVNGYGYSAQVAATDNQFLSKAIQDIIEKWKTATPAAQDMNEKLKAQAGLLQGTAAQAKLASDVITGLVKESFEPLTEELLQNKIMAGLSGEALLEYARGIGKLNEESYTTLSQLQALNDVFDTNDDKVVDGTEATEEYWKQLAKIKAPADEAAGAIDGIGAAAGTAKTEMQKLNNIDLNLAGTVKTELDKIKLYLAGGLDWQILTEKISESLLAGKITPEQAQDMFQEAYIGAEVLNIKMGEIDAPEASERISKQLGIPISEAKKLVDDYIKRLGDIPGEVSTKLTVTEYHNVVNTVITNYETGDTHDSGDDWTWESDTGTQTGHATGGSFIIPSGYTETYSLAPGHVASSGERVDITPVGQTGKATITLFPNATINNRVDEEMVVRRVLDALRSI